MPFSNGISCLVWFFWPTDGSRQTWNAMAWDWCANSTRSKALHAPAAVPYGEPLGTMLSTIYREDAGWPGGFLDNGQERTNVFVRDYVSGPCQ